MTVSLDEYLCICSHDILAISTHGDYSRVASISFSTSSVWLLFESGIYTVLYGKYMSTQGSNIYREFCDSHFTLESQLEIVYRRVPP